MKVEFLYEIYCLKIIAQKRNSSQRSFWLVLSKLLVAPTNHLFSMLINLIHLNIETFKIYSFF